MSVKFKGVAFFTNAQEYLLPSLSLKQVEDNYELMAGVLKAPDVRSADVQAEAIATFKLYVPIILMAWQRNYPEVTEENLREWLDLGNFAEAMLIVQNASGFKAAKPGEAPPA
jgi:hypothetical protein